MRRTLSGCDVPALHENLTAFVRKAIRNKAFCDGTIGGLLAATPGSGVQGALPETSNRAPNLLEGRRGCPFADRCPLASRVCRQEESPVVSVGMGHAAACHHVS